VPALVLEAPAAIRQEGAAPPSGHREIARRLYAHPERMTSIPPIDPAARAKAQPLVSGCSDRTVMRISRAGSRSLDADARVVRHLDGVIAPAMGRIYKDLMPNCHLVFVYDAAHAISTDRRRRSPRSCSISRAPRGVRHQSRGDGDPP